MTAFIEFAVPSIILLLASTYFIFWALDRIKSETHKNHAIITYGCFFLTITTTIIIEIFKFNF